MSACGTGVSLGWHGNRIPRQHSCCLSGVPWLCKTLSVSSGEVGLHVTWLAGGREKLRVRIAEALTCVICFWVWPNCSYFFAACAVTCCSARAAERMLLGFYV
jgi:hypothetical protein